MVSIAATVAPEASSSLEILTGEKRFLLIHPEGTRTRSGRLGKFKKGAALLSNKSGVKAVPVYIGGSGRIFPVYRNSPRLFDVEKLKKYFDSLFGIQKTLGNAMNNWKKQMDAVKDISVGFNAAVRGDADMAEKAEQAMNSLDAAIYGDRTEWIRRADEALAA